MKHLSACSPEGQLLPGLHQKNCSQQFEGGDSAPLLCSGETSPGVLHPALEPSAQETHGPVGAGPEEAATMIREEEKLRDGVIQPGEGCRETSLQPFSTYRGLIRKKGTNILAGSVEIGQGVMALNH